MTPSFRLFSRDEVLILDELGHRYGISPSTQLGIDDLGQIPAYRFNRRVLVTSADYRAEIRKESESSGGDTDEYADPSNLAKIS